MQMQAEEIKCEISVVPNPASEAAIILLSEAFDRNCTLSLFSYLGNKIAELAIVAEQTH